MSPTITAVEARDIRFPTARGRHGSDAMNPDPDYSAAYCIVHTDVDGLEGHGLTFTIGRGNELCVAAIEALGRRIVGTTLDRMREDMAGFWRHLTGDSQLRWVGPDKGVVHMAAGAVVNATWDLLAKAEGKPVWQLVTSWSPEQIVAAIDFGGLEDALTAAEALERLQERAALRPQRRAEVERDGIQAYTTSTGWLGYSDAQVRQRATDAIASGWTHFKMKVGGDPEDDVRRAAMLRDVIGPERKLMMDANQVWSVPEAIEAIARLTAFDPWWIEEPTHPDDILGHAAIARAVAPVRIATGEMGASRVMFKQFLASGGMQVCQVDACRLAGLNEVLAVLLLADKAGVPVCPHAGGVGLPEYVQHIALIDAIVLGGASEYRAVEYVDHLHEHFLDPVVVTGGRYRPPHAPGYSVTMKPASLAAYAYPHGSAWQSGLNPSTERSAP